MQFKNTRKGILFVVIGCIFWGGSGTVAEYTFSHSAIPALWLVGIRLFFAGLLLLLWFGITKGAKEVFSIWGDRRSATLIILFAFLGMLPSQLSYFMAIRFGNAPTATVLQFLGPIFIILYLTVAQHRWPSRTDSISVLIALLGTALLVTGGDFTRLSLAPLALFWGIAAGLGQASYTLLPRLLLDRFDGRLVVGWAMLLGSLPFWPYLLTKKVGHLTTASTLSVGFIVIFGTMLAYLFYINSLNYIEPTVTGMLSSVEPLTATFLSVVFLKTDFSAVQFIGGLLVISTVFLQALPQKAEKAL
ncbi:permease of the drug/metabolite transporter superfamily [Fructobacillus pseudoficulneus]|uniref:Permease of the drug/metabolite transporter superfamily n=1 Tax=Fructobacillus pseudoficulneus TaxID=220714 RepID=A0A3F3GXI0_9LACO|nr:EamA family transporter [Fructobacillus pseudoficulneus]GAP03394.1 permease of the drug/metabolite transporter superfamily [Fructobacillus pseudoficulneus]SEH46220.1 Threonine/homoserine efflux transporter RhtA [Fructobacillus pseudoficulneus]